jgi:FkbM family methyltransferase
VVRTERVDTPFGSFDSFEGDFITQHLVEFGAHQRSDLAVLLSFVQPGDCVLDIGAHIGTFSVPLGKAVGRTGRVVAFEPVAEHFGLLERNIESNDLLDIVQPVRAVVALGNQQLHVHRVEGNTGATSFLGLEGESAADIPIVSLDGWWKSSGARPSSVEAVKIDVEGMEHEVLSSGAYLIDTFRPVVLFEVDTAGRQPPLKALDAFFASRGYRLFVNLAGRNLPTDTFKLARLRRVALLSRAQVILDVVAVDPASERYPQDAASAIITGTSLLRLAARQRAIHLLRPIANRVRRRAVR